MKSTSRASSAMPVNRDDLPAIVQLADKQEVDVDEFADKWRKVIQQRKINKLRDSVLEVRREPVSGVESWCGYKVQPSRIGKERIGLKSLQNAPLYVGLIS